jgi:hypothetical protein
MSVLRCVVLSTVVVFLGCGHLSVDVSVLDPRIVEVEQDRLSERDLLPIVLNADATSIQEKLGKIKTDHFAFYTETAAAYRAVAATLSGADQTFVQGIADDLEQDFFVAWNARYDEWSARLTAIVQDAQQQHRLVVEAEKREESFEARAERERRNDVGSRGRQGAIDKAREDALHAYAARTSALRRYSDMADVISLAISEDSHGKVESVRGLLANNGYAGVTLAAAIAPIENAVNAGEQRLSVTVHKSIAGGRKSIERLPYAHAVASAPKRFWHRPFNRAYGMGFFGNVDIAIALDNETGNYTVKGMLFDPSDVANAISKVTTQALVLAAQAYGVPVPPPTGSTNGNGSDPSLGQSSKELSRMEAEANGKERTLNAYRSAITNIALSILEKRDRIVGADAAARQQAIQAIKATYEAQKSRIVSGGN